MDRFHRLNAELDIPFTLVAAGEGGRAVRDWLPYAMEAAYPSARRLIDELQYTTVRPVATHRGLNAAAIVANGNDWRARAAACEIHFESDVGFFQCSYDEAAWARVADPPKTGSCCDSTRAYLGPLDSGGFTSKLSFQDLALMNDRASGYTVTDACHGGCGASMAAVHAGLRVTQGWDIFPPAIKVFETLTGVVSLGDISHVALDRLAFSDILMSSTMCNVWSPAAVHTARGQEGLKSPAGQLFTKQFTWARAVSAKAVVLEQVPEVLTLNDGGALEELWADAALNGYIEPVFELVRYASFGSSDNTIRITIVSFDAGLGCGDDCKFPAPLVQHDQDIVSMASVMVCSSAVAARFWYDGPITFVGQRFDQWRVNIIGKVNNHPLEGVVVHPMGLMGTQLASGNTRWVLCIRLRALCLLRMALVAWRSSGWERAVITAGTLACRKLTPAEDMIINGFPALGYPQADDSVMYRLINMAVNVNYHSQVMSSVADVLRTAGVAPGGSVNTNAYRTRARRVPLVPQGVGGKSYLAGVRVGEAQHPGPGRPTRYRKSMAYKPFTPAERAIMSATREKLGKEFYASQSSIDAELEHWVYHCTRVGIHPYLTDNDTEATQSAFLEAAVEFALLELGDHGIRGSSVAHKFWAVRKAHANRFLSDPFEGCFELSELLRRAKKLDPDPVGKLPVTVALLKVLYAVLDCTLLEHRVIRAYYMYGFAYGSRVSEIAIKEKFTVLWSDLHFYLDGVEVDVMERDPLNRFRFQPDELEAIQQADKTTRRGKGVPRSHFLNGADSSWCIVRALCALKRDLRAVGMAKDDDPVFSWSDGAGVTRPMAGAMLKEAASMCGIPKARISCHSLRSGAMTAFRAAGIGWPETKMFLRWKSDSAADLYNWPHTRLVAGKAAQIFSSAPIHRLRGLFVHCMGGLA